MASVLTSSVLRSKGFSCTISDHNIFLKMSKTQLGTKENVRSKRHLLKLMGLVVAGAAAWTVGLGLLGLVGDGNTNSLRHSDEEILSHRKLFYFKPGSIPTVSRMALLRVYRSCDDLARDIEIVADMLIEQAIMQHVENWQYFGGFQPPQAAPDIQASPPIPTNEDSFETNIQVDGVDEPDIIKSDGTYVWAVYGSEIVKLQVNVLSRTEIPTDQGDQESSTGNLGSSIFPCDRRARVAGMLLVGDRLVVMTVPNFCFWFRRRKLSSPIWGGCQDDSIVSSDKVNVIVYDKNSMAILAQESLQGRYMDARAVGNNIHVIASTSFNYYCSLTNFFEPWNVAPNATTAIEYELAARSAVDERRGAFVEKMVEELDCETLQGLTLMQDTEDVVPGGSYFQGMSHIHSFDVTTFPSSLSKTSMFQPSSHWQVYASRDQLVLATRGRYAGDDSKEQTFLLTYRLVGPATYFLALGRAPGRVLNQFSMDFHETSGVDYLRVATTTDARWEWDDEADEQVQVRNSTNQVTILKLEGGNLIQVGASLTLESRARPFNPSASWATVDTW